MEDDWMRYAHSDGHTDVTYDETGNFMVTCGTDGEIRIWKGFEDDDPRSHNMGINVSAVALKKEKIYVSSDNFAVSSYSFPEAEFDQIIAQFNTTVFHIVCNIDGNLVACGGGDFIIKMYDNATKMLTEFRGHTGPILSLAFDPNGVYLASSSCDGTVRLWRISTQECVKTLSLFKKSNDFDLSSTLCRLDWNPDGRFLAIPVENEVKFYERELWDLKFSISDECVKQTISIATYSPSGNYIASSTTNGQMLIWEMSTKKCISRKMHEKEKCISGLKWNPSGKELVFCDIEGQMGIYGNPISSSSAENKLNDVASSTQDVVDADDFLDAFADEDAVDDSEFDIGAIKASLEPKIFGEDELEDIPVISEPEPKIQVVEAPKAPVQTSFQPSSTPIHLERRFMLWNNVGIVRCYNTDEENSIDVEFHDANVYHPLHISNTRSHTMAALSSEALLLASPIVEQSPSKLECLHFGTWDSNKEWIVEMPEGEEIETIALGEGFAVCITDKRIVRLFTISGVQCEVFLVPGSVVSCSAANNQLLIAYHKGTGIRDDQCVNLMYVKVKMEGHSSVKESFLPLSPKAFLTWLGYTDEGSPCVVDTSGIISVLSTTCGLKWVPVADTSVNAKGKSNTYFIIGLSEIKQEIRCIFCKGSRYPALLPRPTIAVLPFSLPFCEMATDKGRLEEENQRLSLSHKCMEGLIKSGFDLDSEWSSASKKQMDILLKMFVLAVSAEREFRALNIAELMPNPVTVQGAIKYATKRHRIALAERLGEVMSRKINKEEESDHDEDTYEDLSESLISKSSTVPNLKSCEKEDSILKPKPLSRVRSQVEKLSESIEEASTSNSSLNRSQLSDSISLIHKSSSPNNPFRAGPKSQAKKDESFSVGSIDEMLNNSMKNIASKSSTVSEKIAPKKMRFPTKKKSAPKSSDASNEKKKNGFDLYLEENKEKIKSSASEVLSDMDVIKTALKSYKALSQSEKQKYQMTSEDTKINKADENDSGTENQETHIESKENNSNGLSNGVTEHAAKRSKETEDSCDSEGSKPKKLKPNHNTSNSSGKLTQFAFFKKSK